MSIFSFFPFERKTDIAGFDFAPRSRHINANASVRKASLVIDSLRRRGDKQLIEDGKTISYKHGFAYARISVFGQSRRQCSSVLEKSNVRKIINF